MCVNNITCVTCTLQGYEVIKKNNKRKVVSCLASCYCPQKKEEKKVLAAKRRNEKNGYLLTFLCYSVSKAVHAETDHDEMMLTLGVQTKIAVATET